MLAVITLYMKNNHYTLHYILSTLLAQAHEMQLYRNRKRIAFDAQIRLLEKTQVAAVILIIMVVG